MARPEIVLRGFRTLAGFTVLWTLEELGLPYRVAEPAGDPLLQIGEVTVTGLPAICIYLADRFGYGSLAPYIERPARGPWLTWLVYAAALLEPAEGQEVDADTLARALRGRTHVVEDQLTAADLVLATALARQLQHGELPRDRALVAYVDRLQDRRAWRRAADTAWRAQAVNG